MPREVAQDMTKWKARKKEGDGTEERFVRCLEQTHGLHVGRTSQHHYESGSQLTRHFPDMFIMEKGVLVQVKSGRNSGKWLDVLGQKASIDACLELHDMGREVWAIWEYPDGSFYGNKVQDLKWPRGKISEEAKQHGSKTPAYKVAKSSLMSLDELLSN